MGRYYKQNFIENVQIDGYNLPCECYVEVMGGGKVVYTHNGIKEITGIKNRKVRITGRLEGNSYNNLLSQIKPIMALGKKTEALDITSLTADAYGIKKIIIENEPQINLISGFDNSRTLSIEADEELDDDISVELLEEGRKAIEEVKARIEPKKETYTIKKGDSLSKIALREYGDFRLWKSIYGYNREIVGDDPNSIVENTEITIPSLNSKEIELVLSVGDTYSSLAEKYFHHSSFKNAIKRANGYKELAEGDVLKLPAALDIRKRKAAKSYASR